MPLPVPAVAANATMAKALFKQSRVSLGSVPHRELLADLLGPSMLSSPYRDTRLAAGSSLAAAVEELGGDCLEIALESLILSYVPGSTDAVRSGVGIGLAKCAVLMNATQVTAAVQFLLGRGLADPASGVR